MSNFKALLAGYKAPKKVKAARPPSPPPPRETEDDRLRAMLLERGPHVMRDVRREAERRVHRAGSAEDLAVNGGPVVVAVLFMLREGLPFEEHWRLWIEAATKNGLEVHVFAHSHHPEKIRSIWLKTRLIRARFNTTWGSLDLVKASNALLDCALRDAPPTCARFMFASESCLPIVHPELARTKLFGAASAESPSEGQSWLRARNRPNNGYSGQLQFDPVSVAVPKAARWKSDQWICLTRAHAEAIHRLPRALGVNLLGFLKRTRAPDELYYPICLALLGELPIVENAVDLGASSIGAEASLAPHILGQRLTYCDWSGASAKSPATLTWSAETVAAADSEGCLLSRKYAVGAVPLEVWGSAVLKQDFELPAAPETTPRHLEEGRSELREVGDSEKKLRKRSRSRSRSRDHSRRRSRSRSPGR